MLNPKNILPGDEQYQEFTPVTVPKYKRKKQVYYYYRSKDGELFNCIKKSLDECRAARDEWLWDRE